MGKIRIGTSGWSYPHWRGPFYPHEVRKHDWLAYYARHFSSAEINGAFYRIPKAATFKGWAEQVPADFVFTLKASRYITHLKKLREPSDSLQQLLTPAAELGERLGPILFQLPPRWRCNPDRLRTFLAELPQDHRYAFEFRDASWFTSEIEAMLKEANAALCIHDHEDADCPDHLTADFTYVRLHGPGGKYEGRYSDRALQHWAARMSEWAGAGHDVFCFFDNDAGGHAALDALRLRDLLARTGESSAGPSK